MYPKAMCQDQDTYTARVKQDVKRRADAKADLA